VRSSPSYRWLGPAALALIALALGALFAWEVHSAGNAAIDDAYITFSYSKNLASGFGPVYGHGVRVEGYSNFLWMVVVAFGLLFNRGADPLLTARALAVPFLILLGCATYGLARVRASRLLSIALVGLLAINADLTTAYLMGLETVAYTALLTFAFLLYALSLDDRAGGASGQLTGRFAQFASRLASRSDRWVVPAFVAVALTRIDGFIPLAFVLFIEACRRLWRREGTVRDYLVWAGPGVTLYLLWFAWRWTYYGLPLPTTYYAKALIPKLLPNRGWEYVRNELEASYAFVALPFAAILIARRRTAGVALGLLLPLYLYYVVRTGGDWMPYGRFVMPVFPLALVIIAWGGTELVDLARRWLPRAGYVLLLLPLAALASIARHTERHLPDNVTLIGKHDHAAEQAGHVANLKTGARLLNWAMPPGARLVTDYGGVFAYYTHAAPIEMWGLCNPLIARKGGTEGVNPIYGRTCPDCYPELKPEFFHVMTPMPRPLDAFHSHAEVVRSVWQTDTIGRYLDFAHDFIAGRAMMPHREQAMYFLERRRAGVSYVPRRVDNGLVVIDYPFEPGGRSPDL
jgi:hypothetical protein